MALGPSYDQCASATGGVMGCRTTTSPADTAAARTELRTGDVEELDEFEEAVKGRVQRDKGKEEGLEDAPEEGAVTGPGEAEHSECSSSFVAGRR